jgi:hypothetical protein
MEGEMRKMLTLGVVSLVSTLLLAAGMLAQAQRPSQPAPGSEPTTVISGNDIGFRLVNRHGNVATGRFVVRVNGQWLEVEESVTAKRLTAQ